MIIDGRRQLSQGSNFAVQEQSGGTGRTDGLVRGIFRQVYNASGVVLPYGAPVVLNTTYAGVGPVVVVTLPVTPGDQPYGVIVEPGGINDATSGAVMLQGTHPALRVQGSVTNHDNLYLATTAGYATATRPNDLAFGFAKALIGLSTSSNGTVPADVQTFAMNFNSLPHRTLQGVNHIKGHTNLLLSALSFRDSNSDDASEVNDGSTTTFESDFNIVTNYVQADMGVEIAAGGFELLVTAPGAAQLVVVTASHDAASWTELYRETMVLPSSPATVRGGFKSSTFRYWRISVQGASGPNFYEWALYEPSGLDLYAYKLGSVDASYQSNGPLDATLQRLDHHVDMITASSSNQFIGTVELRPGIGVAFSVSSNTMTISATGGSSGSTSYGSNSNSVSDANAGGASPFASRADHVHQGVHQITSNTSNGLVRDINLQAGTGIALGVLAQTITITATSGGGGGSTPAASSGDGPGGKVYAYSVWR